MNAKFTALSDREFFCSGVRSFLLRARGFPFSAAHA